MGRASNPVPPVTTTKNTVPLALREGDRGRLEAMVRSVSARRSLARRARIILMSAEGLTNTEIARRTASTRPTVISWRNRYATGGINALRDLPRSGRPAVVDELKVVATTLADGGRPPAHLGASHWSSRLLAQHLGISFATVARIWRKWGIQPDHLQTVTSSAELRRQGRIQDLLEARGGNVDRQVTSDTHTGAHKESSLWGENPPSRDLERSSERARDAKPVRAEFHGTRGRRSGPSSRPGS